MFRKLPLSASRDISDMKYKLSKTPDLPKQMFIKKKVFLPVRKERK